MKLDDGTVSLLLTLDTRGHEILTAYPLEDVTLPKPQIEMSIAVLGLLDKMTGAAAVIDSEFVVLESGLLLRTELRAFGLLGERIEPPLID
jgi:hypothetical protein